MLKSFMTLKAAHQHFSWSASLSLHTRLASYFHWAYFPWCEIIMHKIRVSSLQYNGGNSWKMVFVLISAPKRTQIEHWFYKTAVFFKTILELKVCVFSVRVHPDVCPSPAYVPSAVLGCFSYFSCTNVSRQIWRGRTELAASPCILVKGQRVHNAGAAEYQGL